MPDFLNIPGNIRQQYMPFTIAGDDNMQLFTFKEKMRKHDHAAVIHPFSKHLGTLIQNDSSISYTHGPSGSKKIDYETFLDEIPALQIREFVPDAKLTQMFKWFSYFKKGFDNAMKSLDSEAAGGWDVVKGKLEEALNSLGDNMKKLTSGDAAALAKVVSGLQYFYQDRGFNVGDDKGLAVLWLPFILYYRLTTTHTNNIYEFPTLMQNNIFESDGTYGWGDDNGTDFPILDVLGNKAQSLVGLVSSGLASTIKVNAMPAFSPTGSAAATSFDVHIDLINDSEEAAINNFLFCHTLFGNNRWLQYGFVQTGASLYDVKFPGANRFFMCKGRFVCKGKGAFRTPSQNVIDGIISHKYDKLNAAKAIASIKGINQTLGEAEAREIFNGEEGQTKRSQQTSDSTIEQIMSNGRNTKIDSIKTRYPNAYITLKNNNTVADAVKRQQESYSKIKTEIKDTQEKISEQQQAISKNRTFISDNNDKIKQNQEVIRDLKTSNPDFFDGDSLKPDIEIPQPIVDQYNNAMSEITVAKSNNQELIRQNNSYKTAIENFSKTISDKKTQLDSFIKSDEMAPFVESLGADAVRNTVVSVSPSTWRDLIKIPDVYSLTLTFSSLIPDNFNNYLYGWRAGNLDPIDDYFLGNVKETGVMEKLVDNLIEAVGKG